MNGLGDKTPTGNEAGETKAKNPSVLFWIVLLVAAIVVVVLLFS